jgi:hypothetical protein
MRTDPLLLRRLEAFALDAPGAADPYSARLARRQGWSGEHALRVMREYKRFVYLCSVSGRELTPSEAVDAAWHEHLVHTRSYWDDMCVGVLGAPLHHAPSRGGPAESARFRASYAATLAAYREAFGEAPPAEIWPEVEARFAPARGANARRPLSGSGWALAALALVGATGTSLAAEGS